MRPHLIIFDCDGVLVDSEPIALRALLESVAEAGLEMSPEVAMGRFLGLSLKSTTAILAEEFGVCLADDGLARMRRRLYQMFERELAPTPGIADALDRITTPCCVASSSQMERIALSLRITGLYDRLRPHIFSATMVARGKPAPDLFLQAATAMGAEPARCLVIEDSPAGVAAARRAGMRVFGYVGGAHARTESHANALREAGAHHVFDDMAALPDLIDALSAPLRRRRAMAGGFYLGVDVGTRSARAGLFNAAGELLEVAKRPIRLRRPRPEIGEQDSEDIWRGVCGAVRECVASSGVAPGAVRGMGVDATTSLVVRDAHGAQVSVSGGGEPGWDVISWLDHRAAAEAVEATAANDLDLGRQGTVISIEMQTPKAMWLKRRAPQAWARAAQLFDLADFLTWRATGSDARSACALISKWPYSPDGEGGWRPSYLARLGLDDLIDRCGGEAAPILLGRPVGALTEAAATELGLTSRCTVASGMIDAHAATLGALPADALEDGSAAALIAGTSSCLMTLSAAPVHAPGVWGPYRSVVLPGFWMNELGQSASGALLDHLIEWHAAGGAPSGAEHIRITDRILELRRAEGPDIAPDLHVIPDFHGDRADSRARGLGMISGLSLDPSFDGLCRLYWRTAVGLALGLEAVRKRMDAGGLPARRFFVAGGHSQSRLLLDLYAAALDAEVEVSASEQPVLLGAAMAGAAAAGAYPDLEAARRAMAQETEPIHADPDIRAALTRAQAAREAMLAMRARLD